YIDWLSQMTGRTYRLLSEAEWEYVARAGTTTPHYWDDPNTVITLASTEIPAGHANCAQCSNGVDIDDMGALEVGHFPPNGFGIYDMLGNAWEFTADSWHSNYQNAPSDGSVWWEGDDLDHRIARGNSFSGDAKNVTATYRFRIKCNDQYPG